MANKKLASHYSFFFKSTFIITLVPEAPNRKPIGLNVFIPEGKATIVANVAAPSIVYITLRRTPPTTVVAKVIVITITEAVPAWKTSK